jgi:hypothetical protein
MCPHNKARTGDACEPCSSPCASAHESSEPEADTIDAEPRLGGGATSVFIFLHTTMHTRQATLQSERANMGVGWRAVRMFSRSSTRLSRRAIRAKTITKFSSASAHVLFVISQTWFTSDVSTFSDVVMIASLLLVATSCLAGLSGESLWPSSD